MLILKYVIFKWRFGMKYEFSQKVVVYVYFIRCEYIYMYINRGLLVITAMSYTTFPVKAKISMVLLTHFNIPYTVKKYNPAFMVLKYFFKYDRNR